MFYELVLRIKAESSLAMRKYDYTTWTHKNIKITVDKTVVAKAKPPVMGEKTHVIKIYLYLPTPVLCIFTHLQ